MLKGWFLTTIAAEVKQLCGYSMEDKENLGEARLVGEPTSEENL